MIYMKYEKISKQQSLDVKNKNETQLGGIDIHERAQLEGAYKSNCEYR